MKHPSREEMMSYLYDELESEPQCALERHLEECAPCRARLAEWRSTTRQLDAYAVAPVRTPQSKQQRWALPALATVAAAVVLFAGFALGRSSGVSRAELERALSETEAKALATGRVEARQQLQQFAADVGKRLDTLQEQQSTDYTSLRKELETVAVLTEAGFRQTENRFVALADTSSTVPPNSTP
jgi:anti-sigma factor RsiW